MTAALLVGLIFAGLALLAVLFVALPVWRARSLRPAQRCILLVAFTVAVGIVGGGLYAALGTPTLALRSLSTPRDIPSLIAALARRAREKPFDWRGWALLGRGYLSLGDAGDAAAAFKRALLMAPSEERAPLASGYVEALTVAASGVVTPEAEVAFSSALVTNPHDPAARYYLGLAQAARGNKVAALTYWQGLLADTPPSAPWRGQLLDHIAAISSQGGSPIPDISAMVAGLAKRLQANPNDPEGWQRLVRSYVVLGDRNKARAALDRARSALRDDPQAGAALDSEAKSLNLD
jgi:cytochrome c-type biogenesis protein CcmH